jgi:arylformamidase
MDMPKKDAARSKKSGTSKSKWIDISIPFRNAMVHWTTDPTPRIERIKDVDRGDSVTLTDIHLISHTGTHIDAPLHFVYHGGTIDEMPLDTAIGPARVIEIKDTESIKPEELTPYNIKPGERILFKTQNSSKLYHTDEFFKEYVYLTSESARYLVDRRVRLVGLDYLSISKYETEAEYPSIAEYRAKSGIHVAHRSFLEKSIYILEGINLSGVKPGNYELICLPIRLERGDAGLARAILRPI